MAKSKTPSFVLTLKLNTNTYDENILHKRFFDCFVIKNKLIKHARKCLSGLRQDKEYRHLCNEYLSLRNKDDPDSKHKRSLIGKKLVVLRQSYGLSEYQFHEWIATQKHKVKNIDIHTCQKIATSVYKAVEDVLYRKGKSIHFEKFDNFLSLEGKSNTSGIKVRNNRILWCGLDIGVQIPKNDKYVKEALIHRVKYCRIVRKPMGINYHYYVQLILEGLPPQKHIYKSDGYVGIDQGVSTEAIVSNTGCELIELANNAPKIDKDISKIQRAIERSRRVNNPSKYNKDGTFNKGNKDKWDKSKKYKKLQLKLKTLYRRRADTNKQFAEVLANNVLINHGTDIFTENMNYKALQAKAKETAISEKTHCYKSKKRFGKSIGYHAPARFVAALNRKLSYIGKEVNEVNTKTYRASQYNHYTDTYEKQKLSNREKYINGIHVQRDLYSAYLLMNAKSPDIPDKQACIDNFNLFIKHHNETIISLLKDNHKYPSCMGLDKFKYLLTN